ncbi:hypothetical protein GRI69_10260 [Erythrobacter vulgaris]|uniref:Uncharacterized protein n=1 Tax=Qipengyuania vulgaris TaxID=291985 RepID=A0A844XRS1_9SPHN|nr:hypothetical protein [Qipengyuania vulgaris]MXO48641.1 hypothetical protein [Qipengyuania vulgaris]
MDEVDKAVSDQGAIGRAKENVVRQEPDPAAVQFRDVVQVGDMVCGDLNGKNLVGAYVGFRPFIYREFDNGLFASQTTGLNQYGIETRIVDGCLFPLADQCHRELEVSTCTSARMERHVASGYPMDQMGFSQAPYDDFTSGGGEPLPEPAEAEEAEVVDETQSGALVGSPIASATEEPERSTDQLKLDWSRFDFECNNALDDVRQEAACAEREATEAELAVQGLCRAGGQWNDC